MRYETLSEVLDFGPFVTKAVLYPDTDIKGKEFSPSDFDVYVSRKATGPEVPWPEFMGPKPDMQMEGHRPVSSAYISDKDGNPDQEGACITLTFDCHPDKQLGSNIVFNGIFNVSVEFSYTIKFAGQTYDENLGNRLYLGDLLKVALHEDKEIPLKYAYYDPKESKVSSKYPLIVWLHGAGEGGDEPKIAAIGNKVVNLISPEIQDIFGGAYLLAPQSPTMWMDDGTGEYTKDGSSKYTEALDRLIGDFISEHKDIDTDRVYIGGDSNGGFMTMKQIIHNPSRYAAAFPVCEALADSVITDDMINSIKDLPIWFTHAATDPVVKPDEFPIPTYKRLVAAGGKNIHFTYWDKLEDQTGLYKKADGTPYEYIGHWAWIPMLNDACKLDFNKRPVMLNGKETSIIPWIAAQHR